VALGFKLAALSFALAGFALAGEAQLFFAMPLSLKLARFGFAMPLSRARLWIHLVRRAFRA